MRIIYSFIIVLTAVFLMLLPHSDMVYEFRTEAQTDNFSVETGAGVSSSNITLDDFIYDNDDDTIEYDSSIDETPVTSSYNATTKTLLVSSLTANTTRTLEITYDVDAIEDNDAINALLDRFAWIWMLVNIAWPMASLAAIWTGRA